MDQSERNAMDEYVFSAVFINMQGIKPSTKYHLPEIAEKSGADLIMCCETHHRWSGTKTEETLREVLPEHGLHHMPCESVRFDKYAGIGGMCAFYKPEMFTKSVMHKIPLFGTDVMDNRQFAVELVTCDGVGILVVGAHFKSGFDGGDALGKLYKGMQVWSAVEFIESWDKTQIIIFGGDWNADPTYLGIIGVILKALEGTGMTIESINQIWNISPDGRMWTRRNPSGKSRFLDHIAVRTGETYVSKIRLLQSPEYYLETDHDQLLKVTITRNKNKQVVPLVTELEIPIRCKCCGHGSTKKKHPCKFKTREEWVKRFFVIQKEVMQEEAVLRKKLGLPDIGPREFVCSKSNLLALRKKLAALDIVKEVEPREKLTKEERLFQERMNYALRKTTPEFKAREKERLRRRTLEQKERKKEVRRKSYERRRKLVGKPRTCSKRHYERLPPRNTAGHTFQCKVCHESLKTKRHLHEHTSRKHRGKKECELCGKVMGVYTLKYHMQEHEGKQEYKCEDCDKSFNTVHQLWRHVGCAHRKRDQLFCTACGVTYSSNTLLRQHLFKVHGNLDASKIHTSDPIVKVEKVLAKHTVMHYTSGKNEFRCGNCRKVLKTLSELKEHVTTHQKVSCNICGKPFGGSGVLKKHVGSVHNGRPRRKCPLCSTTFSMSTGLNRHLREIHSVGVGEIVAVQ